MKYLGCAYYPEYWGVDRVETDAKLMKEAGINFARIGEFAWSRMEPQEGVFTLDWLNKSIEILNRYGIKVLMCTPSATPPAWLASAYPDTVIVKADGKRLEHGNRKHFCSTSDTYRRHCRRIIEVLCREMKKHENVIAWQIDNELGPEVGWCYCENCQSRFRAWLLEKYGSLETLNRAWGTGFWSMDYSDWRQVRLGSDPFHHYSSRNLDSKRFFSDMMIDYGMFQANIIRENHPGSIVTTNGMGPIYPHINYYQLFKDLDVACDDLYFDIGTMDADVAAMNVFRSIKPGKKFWITETGSGALDHNKPPHKKQFRAWAWSAWAHGSEAHFIFRWRTCLSGQEQELQGILEHSGLPRHRYQAVKECFNEFNDLAYELDRVSLPKAEVAIIQDYDVLWAYDSVRVGPAVNYLPLVYQIHKKLYARNILTDIIDPGQDFRKYKLIILPSMVMLDKEFADRLRNAVYAGATVFSIGQMGMRDKNNNYLPYPGPFELTDLFGIKIHGGMYLDSQVGVEESIWTPDHRHGSVTVAIKGSMADETLAGMAGKWIADIEAIDCESLFTFQDEAYQYQPAVTEKRYGKGKAIYQGFLNGTVELEERIFDDILAQSNVQVKYQTPLHVEVVERDNFICVVNHLDRAVEVNIPSPVKAVLGTYEDGKCILEPYGVGLLRCI